MSKATFLIRNNVYQKNDIIIPDFVETHDFVNDIISKFNIVNLKSLFITFDDNTCVYFNGEKTYFCENIDILLGFVIHLELYDIHKNYIDINGKRYIERDIIQLNPELINILPIDSEFKVKEFLNYLINNLNINYDPSKNKNITDNIINTIDGKKIFLDSIDIDWIQYLIEICYNIVGNEIFNIVFEIKNIKKEFNSILLPDENLKKIFSELKIYQQTILNFLSDSKNNELFYNNLYPYSKTFDKLEINKWYGFIVGNFSKITGTYKVNFNKALLGWIQNLNKLNKYCSIHTEFDNLVFDKNYYPFDFNFKDVIEKTNIWINSILNLNESSKENQEFDFVDKNIIDKPNVKKQIRNQKIKVIGGKFFDSTGKQTMKLIYSKNNCYFEPYNLN
jgi:hypothetical protein